MSKLSKKYHAHKERQRILYLVQQSLRARRSLRGATEADTASRLNISATTLRRRLRPQGTSHKTLLDIERQRRLDRALSCGIKPAKTLIDELGFSHISIFYRWHLDKLGYHWQKHKAILKDTTT